MTDDDQLAPQDMHATVDGDDAIRPYGGSVERPHPIFAAHGELPWRWAVEVTPLEFDGFGKTWEVRVTRFGGPKLEGTPDPVGVRLAQVDDVVAARPGERAIEIAKRCVEDLKAGAVPNLKRLSISVRHGSARPGDL